MVSFLSLSFFLSMCLYIYIYIISCVIHSNTHLCFIYIYIILCVYMYTVVKLATLVEGDPEGSLFNSYYNEV